MAGKDQVFHRALKRKLTRVEAEKQRKKKKESGNKITRTLLLTAHFIHLMSAAKKGQRQIMPASHLSHQQSIKEAIAKHQNRHNNIYSS